MDWAIRRRLMVLGLVAIIIIAPVVWRIHVVRSRIVPTCTDALQNGDETGVDCGGSCARMCVDTALPLVVLWTRAVPVTDTVYHAVALVENQNRTAAQRVRYTFSLYDAKNILIAERRGESYVPANQPFALTSFGIPVGARRPAFAFVALEPIESWQKVDDRMTHQVISSAGTTWTAIPSGSRLTTTIANNESVVVYNAVVTAIGYDASNTAVAVSSTTVDKLGPSESTEVSFTWPGTLNPVRTQIITSLNPFSQINIPLPKDPTKHTN